MINSAYSLRKLHLINRAMMASELKVGDSPKLDTFESLCKKHPFVLKVIARDSEINKNLLSTFSLRGMPCWLVDANRAYLFSDEISLCEWSRLQHFSCAEEEIFLEYLRSFLYRISQQTFEMVGERFLLNFGGPTRIMGILNSTSDSFYDGGRYGDTKAAIARGLEMESEGADIIDVGGESTRPGAMPVEEAEELARVVPVINGLASEIRIPISVDTYKAPVAEAAIQAGATIVNDVSGLRFDPQMTEVALHYNVPVVLMHMRGRPRDMQVNPSYENLMDDLYLFFEERLAAAESAGLSASRLILDPGLGFGKRLWDNYEIMQRLPELRGLGCPILVGPSRKSFIGKVLDLPVDERLEGTAAAVAALAGTGCDIVRVHDVKEMLRVIQVADLIYGNVILQQQEF